MNGKGDSSGENYLPAHRQEVSGQPSNGTVKNSVMDAMLLLVFSLCFIGVVTFFIGLGMLNSGLYGLSVEESVNSGMAATDVMKGLVNLIIGIALLFGSYGFVMYTVERKSWWHRLR